MRREKPKQAVFLLLAELLRSDRLPPVTLALIGLNAVIYLELFDFDYPSLATVCLSAHEIINRKQWLRLILAPFFHVDDWHLYYNMISLSIKGRSLEKKYGSKYFLVLLAVFTTMFIIVYVLIQYILFISYDMNSLTSCAVGFSGKETIHRKNIKETIFFNLNYFQYKRCNICIESFNYSRFTRWNCLSNEHYPGAVQICLLGRVNCNSINVT